VAIECYTDWQYEPPDEDLTSYNPTEGPFSCIHSAFDSSIDSEKILSDAIKLPQDNCQAIAIIAIAKSTARAISDGSYDPPIHKGTSSLTIVADKHERDPLDGDNRFQDYQLTIQLTGANSQELQESYRQWQSSYNNTTSPKAQSE
jgi:hypothetical protein